MALLLLAGVPTADAEPMPPHEFRDRVAAAVTAATHQPAVIIDDWSFRTHQRDGGDITVHIDNLYAQYRSDPAHPDDFIARFVQTITASRGFDEGVDQLVVIVRPVGYVAQALPAGAVTDQFIAARSMAGDLAYYLAVDAPDTIRLVMRADLDRWQIDEATAWRRGVANIRVRIGPLQLFHLDSEDGATGMSAQSGLAPSLLADPTTCGRQHRTESADNSSLYPVGISISLQCRAIAA